MIVKRIDIRLDFRLKLLVFYLYLFALLQYLFVYEQIIYIVYCPNSDK